MNEKKQNINLNTGFAFVAIVAVVAIFGMVAMMNNNTDSTVSLTPSGEILIGDARYAQPDNRLTDHTQVVEELSKEELLFQAEFEKNAKKIISNLKDCKGDLNCEQKILRQNVCNLTNDAQLKKECETQITGTRSSWWGCIMQPGCWPRRLTGRCLCKTQSSDYDFFLDGPGAEDDFNWDFTYP